MDHRGEAAWPTAVGSVDLGLAGAVQGGEANVGTGSFDGQLGVAAAPRDGFEFGPSAAAYRNSGHARATAARDEAPVHVLSQLHHGPGPGVAYPNIGDGEFRRQRGPVRAALLGPHLPDGLVQAEAVVDYSARQPRPRAGRGVVLADLLPGGGGGGGSVHYGDYALQPRPGAGHGEVLVILLPDGAGHGDAFVGQLLGGVGAAYDAYVLQPRSSAGHGQVLVDQLTIPNSAGHGQLPGGGVAAYGDYALQPRSGARHGEVLVDQLTVPNSAGHGQLFAGQLPGGGVDAAYDNYGYYTLQPRSGDGRRAVLVGRLPDEAGHGQLFAGQLPGGGVAAYDDDYGYYALQPRSGAGHGEVLVDRLLDEAGHGQLLADLLPGDGRGEVSIAIGPLPDSVGVVFDGSGNFGRQTLPAPGTRGADGIAGALRGVVAGHLRRVLPIAGIGACSVAVNGLAASPGSPAVAFDHFVLLLGGLFLVILHVLRV